MKVSDARSSIRKVGPNDWQLWVPTRGPEDYDETGCEVGMRGTTYHRTHRAACEHLALALRSTDPTS